MKSETYSTKQIIEEALERGLDYTKKIIEKDCLNTYEFAQKANLPTPNPGEWLLTLERDQAKYFCITEKNSEEKYWPKWQLDTEGNVPEGFDAINALLRVRNLDEWSIYQFWVGSEHDIEGLPRIERLRQGEIKNLIKSAGSRYLFQGGS